MATEMTITEGLAELNTIQKRLEKKRQFVINYLSRPDGLRDPLEKSGGSVEALKRERQAISDLSKRHLAIRMAIQKINHSTVIRVGETRMTVSEWLTWRKEQAPAVQTFLTNIRASLDRTRQQAQQRGQATVSATAVTSGSVEAKPQDILVNVDEAALAKEAEALEETLGTLDGQLSLINATTKISIED